MLDALRFLMAPPPLVVLGGIVAAVAGFARLFRRPSHDRTAGGGTGSDPLDSFLLSLGNERSGE